jgi:hypothetical protein
MVRVRARGNVRSKLKRRRRNDDPMSAYDRLPSALRLWLMDAALPWSAQSAYRAWCRSLRASGGDTEAAKRNLSRLERDMLKKDRIRLLDSRDYPTGVSHVESRV